MLSHRTAHLRSVPRMLALFLLHVLPTVLPVSPEPPESSYLTEFRRGELALEEGRYASAAEAFDACLRVSPENSICAFYQACVAAQSGSLEVSMAWVERALDWGYEDLRMFEVEPDLSPLQEVPAFESMIDGARQGERPPAAVDQVRLAWAMGGFPRLSDDGSRLVARNAGVMDIDSEEFMYFLDTGAKGTDRTILGPAGDLLFTLSRDKTLACWDAWSGEFLRRFDGKVGPDRTLSITNDGRHLLCREKIWDVETGALKLSLPVPERASGTSRIDPQGRFALTALRDRDSGRAVLWNLETGRELASHENVGTPMYKLGFDTSSKYAWVIGHLKGQEWLTVFDLGQAEVIHNKPVEYRLEPILLPFQEGVFASFADTLHLIDPIRGEFWESLESSPRRWADVCADAHGRPVLTAGKRWSRRGPIVARDLYTGREVWKLAASPEPWWRYALTLYPDRFLIVSRNGLEIRESGHGRLLHRANPFGPRTSPPLVLSASDRVVVTDSGGDVSVFDIRKGIRVRRFSFESETRNRPRGTQQSTRVLISRRGSGPGLVDIESGEVLRECSSFGTLAPDGSRILEKVEEQGFMLVDVDRGQTIATMSDLEARYARWSPDGRRIALVGKEVVTLWNGVSGEPLGISLPHPERVWCLAFDAPGSRLATGTGSGDVRIWDVDSGELQEVFPNSGFAEGGRVSYIEFSPDGSHLVCTGHGGFFWMWNIERAEQIWNHAYFHGNPATMYAHFDDEGERIYVSGQSGSFPAVFEAATGKVIAGLWRDRIGYLRYVSPGRFVGGGGGKLRVYDEETCDTLYAWAPFPDGESLMHTRQGYFSCSRGLERRVHLLGDPTSHPLESFAAALYDPKRVRAAVTGVHFQSLKLRTPPRLTLLDNQRFRKVSGESVRLAATAADPEGIDGFWIEVDGSPIPRGQLAEAAEISEDETSASLDLNWPVNERVTFRLQAVGTTGLLSRPRWITAEPQ